MIVLSDVPRRIAETAIARRIDGPAYRHVVAFAVGEAANFHFTYRTPHRELIQNIVSPGHRPLFTAD